MSLRPGGQDVRKVFGLCPREGEGSGCSVLDLSLDGHPQRLELGVDTV